MAAAKPSAYFVRPAARIYMDAPAVKPVDPMVRAGRSGCTVPAMAGDGASFGVRTARASGAANVSAKRRSRVTAPAPFKCRPPSGQAYSGWIDRERRFPLRIKIEHGDTHHAGRDQGRGFARLILRASGRLWKIQPGSPDRTYQAKRCVGGEAGRRQASRHAPEIRRALRAGHRGSLGRGWTPPG